MLDAYQPRFFFQLAVAFGRQMSRPLARKIIEYAIKHPYLRNKILVPVGRSKLTESINMIIFEKYKNLYPTFVKILNEIRKKKER